MIRKYHDHKPQTNPRRREEEPHNHHKTPGRQTKQSNQLSLPHQDDGHKVGPPLTKLSRSAHVIQHKPVRILHFPTYFVIKLAMMIIIL